MAGHRVILITRSELTGIVRSLAIMRFLSLRMESKLILTRYECWKKLMVHGNLLASQFINTNPKDPEESKKGAGAPFSYDHILATLRCFHPFIRVFYHFSKFNVFTICTDRCFILNRTFRIPLQELSCQRIGDILLNNPF